MLEIIAISPTDAYIIEESGADRIELISAYHEGGLTPSYGMIEQVIRCVNIPVNVMIRPHSHSFRYSDEELGVMKKDIEICQKLGANGVVFGVLNENNDIHEAMLRELISCCGALDITFHRAIDEMSDVVGAIKLLSTYSNIKTVLTSGGKGNITENTTIIREMMKQAGRLEVLIGGGLNLENVGQIIKETAAQHVHFGSAIRHDHSYAKAINREALKRLVAITNANS